MNKLLFRCFFQWWNSCTKTTFLCQIDHFLTKLHPSSLCKNFLLAAFWSKTNSAILHSTKPPLNTHCNPKLCMHAYQSVLSSFLWLDRVKSLREQCLMQWEEFHFQKTKELLWIEPGTFFLILYTRAVPGLAFSL